MTENQHPLTETAAAELWDDHWDTGRVHWADTGAERGMPDPHILDALRAAFDAGREHEREHAGKTTAGLPPQHLVFAKDTEWIEKGLDYRDRLLALVEFVANWEPVAAPADPHHDPSPWQDCTRDDIREGDLVEAPYRDHVQVGVAHHQAESGDWMTKYGCPLTNGDRWPLRRIPAHAPEKETPVTENPTPAEPLARTLLAVPEGHGAPHHDADRIKAGDYVAQLEDKGFVRARIAHHQDRDGGWWTEMGSPVAWDKLRADRPDALTVWPAPTPPAEEVELPTAFGAVITDVDTTEGGHFTRMVRTGPEHFTQGPNPLELRYILAFTLPDGTRARRDGERFVKVREGEK